jgi:peptidoglycan/xylan/chitin deacetylase (PgdA/CDA1 family)
VMSATMRRLLLRASRISGVQRLFQMTSRGPAVLFYHGVEEQIVDHVVQRVQMPLTVFEKQISFLRRHYEVISIDDLHECRMRGNRLDPRHVVLTFDDGYKNNLHVVGPFLQSWNLPFTIFVSTRHISEGVRYPFYYIRVGILYTEKTHIHFRSIQNTFDLTTYEKRLAAARTLVEVGRSAPLDLVNRIAGECIEQLPPDRWAELNARFASDEPMDWDDVRRVKSMGATIGSHCHDHCILHSNQDKTEVYRQLNESKAAIEKNVAECKYLAYPNGTARDVSSVAYSAVKSAQFRMAFTTILGEITPNIDCFLAPRIFAPPEYEEFCYLVNRSGKQNEFYRAVSPQFRDSGPCVEPNSGMEQL